MADLLVRQSETILVVDDNHHVLMMVVSILKAAHFRVLHAISGADAIKVSAEHNGTIDLLLSDVHMPGMNGPELGISIKKSRSEMHVMLMSALPGGDLLVLNYGWAFIQKPFVPDKLVAMVNSVLHSPNRSQGDYGYDKGKPS